MAGNPLQTGKNKGFWDGGASGHGTNKESSGRPDGYPGIRKPRRTGVTTDLDVPPEQPADDDTGKR